MSPYRRHLSPAIPAVLLPLAACLQADGLHRKTTLALGVVACLFMTVSALNIRLLDHHAKDDYRRATATAITALKEGKAVWWQADMNATRYYAYRQGGMPLVNSIQVLESNAPSSLLVADIVIINRPEIRYFNTDQPYETYLKHHFFKLTEKYPGFEVWDNSY